MHLIETAKENVSMGPARKSLVISPETRSICAFHEAGHALVALKTPGAQKIVRATLVPRGPALGMVSYHHRDELMQTKEEMLANMDLAMGGRVAEELIFGPTKITQGASSDFIQATRIAETMVISYGMSEKMGHMAFKKKEIKDLSPETRATIEQETRLLIEHSFTRAKKILQENDKQLHLLANALLEYETLSKEEIEMVVSGQDFKTWKLKKNVEDEQLLALKDQQLRRPATPELSNQPTPAEPQIEVK